ELANTKEKILEPSNQAVVLALYEALNTRDVDTVHQILAPDLEWWFHGPPTHQFLMRILTGATSDINFSFDPQTITSFGPTVIAEGCDHSGSISWVHAWTVTDGIVTQVREYFNTSLTVTRIGSPNRSPSSDYSLPSSSTSEITSFHCPSIWESSLSDQVGKSVPGLVLAL
ncbi:WI12 domain-containing protein, partial [Cephalotus follicularis]